MLSWALKALVMAAKRKEIKSIFNMDSRQDGGNLFKEKLLLKVLTIGGKKL